MKEFSYTIKDKVGIHARPAGMLAKLAKGFESDIVIKKGESSVNLEKLIMLMGMGIKCGDTVTVTVSGADEETAYKAIKEFFETNL